MAIKALIDDFKGKPALLQAKELNDVVSFYSELHVNISQHPYYITFRKKLKELYKNSYKEDMFVDVYMGSDTPTVELCETIFSRLFNVFDSQNSNLNISLKTESDKKDYKSEVQWIYDYFKNEGWKKYQTKFNSFRGIDLKDGKQYIINIEPQFVYYTKSECKKQLQEIIFSFDNKTYFYYTDKFYSKYEKTEQGEYILIGKEENHKIERCPINYFYNDFYNNDSEIYRKNVISSISNKLFDYTVSAVELLMNELAMLNYTKVVPSLPCGYETGEEICKGGRLFYTQADQKQGDTPVMRDNGNTQKLCPVCGFNRIIGSGTTITVDYEAIAEKGISIGDLVQYFTPSVEVAEYHKENLKQLKNDLIETSVGEFKTETREARNETDIKSGYENATKLLTAFGEIYSFPISDTMDISLRFNHSADYGFVYLYMGNRFYLHTKSELLEQKELTTNPIERQDVQQQIIHVEYKHDADKLRRMEILYQILPYAGETDTYFLELVKLGKVSDFDIELRTNIYYYISLYENTKHMAVQALDYNLIKKYITDLVNEKLSSQEINNNLQDDGKTQ